LSGTTVGAPPTRSRRTAWNTSLVPAHLFHHRTGTGNVQSATSSAFAPSPARIVTVAFVAFAGTRTGPSKM
jgi:hypothetical protein